VVKLGKNYGMGLKKLVNQLKLSAGIEITLDQAREIDRAWRKEYKGNYAFNDQLEAEWRRRGGWVLSGLGHPVACDERKKKDITNRVVQKDAHNLHKMYVWLCAQLLEEEGIWWRPVIEDFHDEFIGAFRAHDLTDEKKHKLKQLFEVTAYDRLNKMIEAYVPLRGGGHFARSLAECKLEDEIDPLLQGD
jgi:hypothetical protein